MQLPEFQRRFTSMMLEDGPALEPGLQVYRTNIIESLLQALQATYPLVQSLTGEAFFRSMAVHFIRQHPPAQACLHYYGEGFADFIRHYEAAKQLAYLPDVATFEMICNNAHYARDDGPLQNINAINENSVLPLRHSAQLVDSCWPLLEIRAFCLNERDVPNLNSGGVKVMVYRPAFETLFAKLSEAEFRLLSLLQKGTVLGQALEEIMQDVPDFNFAAFLQRHISLGTFADTPLLKPARAE